MACTGITANTGSSRLIVLSALPNLAMSLRYSATSFDGKTFDQNASPFPKLILRRAGQRVHGMGKGQGGGLTACRPPSHQVPTCGTCGAC